MQSAELADDFVTGAEKEMVGIGEDDLRVQLPGQVALHHALHRGLRADRHEDRGFDDSVRGVDASGACASVGALGFEFKMHYFTVSAYSLPRP